MAAVSDLPSIIQKSGHAHARAVRWRQRLTVGGLAAIYIFIWGLIGLYPIDPNDLDAFFLPSVRIALAGHPLLVYSLRYQTIYPNANGPLSLLPLSLIALVLQALGWLNDVNLRRMLVMAAFSVFGLLLAWEGVAAIERLRGIRLRGVRRGLVYALFACAPTLLHGMLFYGHMELSLMLWLILFAVRSLSSQRPGRAGVALGLAILARSNALIYLLTLGLLLLCRGRWRPLARFGVGAGATVALGMLPFYLADRADLLFSLVTFHGALPVGGGSIWEIAVGTPAEAFAQHADTLVVLASAAVITLVVVVARRGLDPAQVDLYGLLTLTSLAFPLFIKTVWPYYFLDMYVFVAIWWLGRRPALAPAWRWLGLLLPAYFVGCAVLAEYATGLLTNPPALLRESLIEAALVCGFLVLFGAWLICSRDPLPSDSSSASQASSAEPTPPRLSLSER